MRPIDRDTKQQLNLHLKKVEEQLDADGIAIVIPIVPGLETVVKQAIEGIASKRSRCAIILDTGGGVVEIVERMVSVIRNFYQEVFFLIPDHAMSAGTIFAMSGDRIYMSYFSILGPIDPQVQKNGNLVPALSYLNQYQRLSDKAGLGQLNTAEYALLQKLDLGELYQFEQARSLSVDLLEKWLSQYKFKNWTQHTSKGGKVTKDEKRKRANEIGLALSNNERWRSHGREINRETLKNEIKLKIDAIEDNPELEVALNDYFSLLKDYMERGQFNNFVHTKEFF